MICSDAGLLGRTVEHPGPICAYVWRNVIIPVWAPAAFAAEAERDDLHPFHRALAASIVREAVPVRPYRD